MAVLSSLVVQLALESASFQQGLRSARTELKTFSREAGQVARVGRDFTQAARGADALATSLSVVSPRLGGMAQTAVQATVAAKGLAGAIGLIASPAAAAVAAVAGLGLVIGRVIGNFLLTLPVLDQFTSKLAGVQAAGQAAVIKREALGLTPKDFADRAAAAATLAQRLQELGAQLATLQAVGPIQIAAIEAEGAGDAAAAAELRHQAMLARIRGELQERLAAAQEVGRHQAEVEKLRVLAVEQANQEIATAEAELVNTRRQLLDSFLADTQRIFAGLGEAFREVTQRLSIEAALQKAQQDVRALGAVFVQARISSEELARGVFAITGELLALGATSTQIMAILPAEFQRFVASVAPIPAAIAAVTTSADTFGMAMTAATATLIPLNNELGRIAAVAAPASAGLQSVAQAAAQADSSVTTMGFGLNGFKQQVQLTIPQLIALNQQLLQMASGPGFKFIDTLGIQRNIRELQSLLPLPTPKGFPTFTLPTPAFQHGGIVPGSPSQAVPILAHGGERIIPAGSGGDLITINLQGTTILSDERALDRLADRLAIRMRDRQRRHA